MRSTTILRAGAALLLGLALLGPGLAGEPGPAEKEGLAKVQDLWLDLARFCVEKKLGLGARACVERAREAGPVPDASGARRRTAPRPAATATGSGWRSATSRPRSRPRGSGTSWPRSRQDGAPERR